MSRLAPAICDKSYLYHPCFYRSDPGQSTSESYTYLLPVTGAELDRLALVHIFHDLVDAPWLVLVSRRVVGWDRVVLVDRDVLLHSLNILLIILVCEDLRIVAPDPLRQLRRRFSRVKLDFLPVSLLQKLCIGETQLLRARIPDETVITFVSVFL